MTVAVIDPRFMPAVVGSGYLPTMGRIEALTATQSASGEESDTWQVVPGFEAVPVAISPTNPSTETRLPNMTRTTDTQYALLDAYYPQITLRHRLVVDGQAWNILMVDFDSQRSITLLRVEQVGS